MNQQSLDQIQVDKHNLYREESITDLRVVSIRRMIPIKSDGTDDESRKTIYSGQTHIMSQMGALPVNCQIDADSLDEALEKFPAAIKEAVDKMIEEAKEYQRQEASRIVVPKTAPGGFPPQGGQGGQAGGGNIILGS